MGISLGPFCFLLRCKCDFGRTLVFGRQNLNLHGNKNDCERIARELGSNIDVSQFWGNHYADKVFTCLGATELSYMDASPYEGADIIHDLNVPVAPSLEGQFDTVIDGGTLEHVFHIPNALENVARLLKVGGTFISMTVANNWLGHGFYQFSPEFMWRFCDGFGFCAQRLELCRRLDNGGVEFIPQNDPKRENRRIEFNPTPSQKFDLMLEAVKMSDHRKKYIYQSDYKTAWDHSTGIP